MVSEQSEVFSVIFTAQLSKKCFGKKKYCLSKECFGHTILCPKQLCHGLSLCLCVVLEDLKLQI